MIYVFVDFYHDNLTLISMEKFIDRLANRIMMMRSNQNDVPLRSHERKSNRCKLSRTFAHNLN